MLEPPLQDKPWNLSHRIYKSSHPSIHHAFNAWQQERWPLEEVGACCEQWKKLMINITCKFFFALNCGGSICTKRDSRSIVGLNISCVPWPWPFNRSGTRKAAIIEESGVLLWATIINITCAVRPPPLSAVEAYQAREQVCRGLRLQLSPNDPLASEQLVV